VLVEGALSLGFMSGKVDEIITSGKVKRFYPHGTGHWLGMDVHDIGLYQMSYGGAATEPRRLEPGMMFTIEPGFYVFGGGHRARMKRWHQTVKDSWVS
jgi:Xaa-Pro aminopeptidase